MNDQTTNVSSGDAALQARLLRLEDRMELFDLEGRYARTWDSGDAAGWAALFTDDGE